MKSNADSIRAMSNQELAEFLCELCGDRCATHNEDNQTCPGYGFCTYGGGKANGLVKWLQQPVTEEDDEGLQ